MDKFAERDDAQMFFVGKTPFLPHYSLDGVYVAPGGGEWKEDELTAMGGKMVPTFLWPREWQQKRQKALGIKPKGQAKDTAATIKQKDRPSHDILLDYLRNEGSPMSATEMSRDLGWNVSRVRDALTRLKDFELIKPWGTRATANDPQRWIIK